MKVVVDTNIIFSGILSPEGTISDLLLNSTEAFDFYAPSLVLEELKKHHTKLLQLSGLSDDDLEFLKRILFRKIDLIDIETFSKTTWEKAIELTGDIDEFDAPFVALSMALDAPLWTGDKKLINGLKAKGIDWLFTTEEMKNLRTEI